MGNEDSIHKYRFMLFTSQIFLLGTILNTGVNTLLSKQTYSRAQNATQLRLHQYLPKFQISTIYNLRVQSAAILSLITQLIQTIILLSGKNRNFNIINLFDSMSSFLATIMLTLYIVEQWQYTIIWYVTIILHLLPLLVQLILIILQLVIRKSKSN